MKKIAFMFAAAAMFVACTEAPKTATQEQKDSIYNEIVAKCQAAAEEAAVAAVDVNALEYAEGATAEDSAAVINAAKEAAKAAVGALDSVNTPELKAEFETAVAEFEAALNAPVAEAVEAAEEATEE